MVFFGFGCIQHQTELFAVSICFPSTSLCYDLMVVVIETTGSKMANKNYDGTKELANIKQQAFESIHRYQIV